MSYEYQRLQMDQQLLEAMAINAEIISMQAENNLWLSQGQPPKYVENHFKEKADQLWAMSQGAIDLLRG